MDLKKTAKSISILCIFLLALSVRSAFCEKTKIYIRSPESATDYRLSFVYELITNVLDKTVSTDGPYELAYIPKMVFKRLRIKKTQKQFPNLIIRLSGDIYTEQNFEVVRIPINRGIVGYRLLLIHSAMADTFKKISTFQEFLSTGLKAGQGPWTDVEILEKNGIKVVVGNNYEGLFHMLMLKRFDFFPRGTNEIFLELETRKNRYPNLMIEETFALYYPLPRVLVTNKGNKDLAKRIERGLIKAFSDGTHRQLWLKYNREFVEKANLNQRKIFTLENPIALPDLKYTRKEYWYQPGEKM